MAAPDDFVPLAVTSRSGLDESVHHGAVVALAANGEVAFAAGNPRSIIYPRSATKPMQGLAMVRAGLSLPPELLALVCASHDGAAMHVAGVRRILATAGLWPEALANTPALPVDEEAAQEVLRSGGGPAAIFMNCSGKHSGMLATCVHNGWSHDSEYLAPAHPLQLAITAVVDEVCGEPHAHIGIDGCGAPTHAMPLVALARAYRAIASGAAGPSGDAVYAAMTAHPEMVSGPRRDVARFMRGVPGLLAKDGAEGVYALALPDGRAIALKIADGADRARPAVLLAVLGMVGVDVAGLEQSLQVAIMGHGHQVGTVRAILP
jgi:L-asparaginase II